MSGGFIIISDLHLGNHKQFSQEVTTSDEYPGCNSRMYAIIDAIKYAVNYALEHNASAIFVAGDVFHERKTIEVPIFNAVYRLFSDISKSIPLYVMPGNHDMVDLYAMYGERGLTSVYPFKDFCNVIYKPTKIALNDFDVVMLPFNISKETLVTSAKNLLKTCAKSKTTVSLFHHSLDGAVFGPHQFKMPSTLRVSDLPKYDLLFSGHYHMHQSISSFTYVGALLQHNFGERTYDPGFIHVKADGSWCHVKNDISPKFRIFEASTKDSIDNYDRKNYNFIRWSGSIKDSTELKNEFDSAFIHNVPNQEVSSIRSDIKSTDSVGTLLGKYVEVRRGKDDLKNKDFVAFGNKIFQDSSGVK